jgi:hypothetical protein
MPKVLAGSERKILTPAAIKAITDVEANIIDRCLGLHCPPMRQDLPK